MSEETLYGIDRNKTIKHIAQVVESLIPDDCAYLITIRPTIGSSLEACHMANVKPSEVIRLTRETLAAFEGLNKDDDIQRLDG